MAAGEAEPLAALHQASTIALLTCLCCPAGQASYNQSPEHAVVAVICIAQRATSTVRITFTLMVMLPCMHAVQGAACSTMHLQLALCDIASTLWERLTAVLTDAWEPRMFVDAGTVLAVTPCLLVEEG